MFLRPLVALVGLPATSSLGRRWAFLFAGGAVLAGTGPAAHAQPATPRFDANVSVHDPSIVRHGGMFYVFGSHLAAARSTNLQHWNAFSWDAGAGNTLVPDVATQMADAFAWSDTDTFWAPDVRQLGDGRFYKFWCVSRFDSPRASLGRAVADAIEGPYTNLGTLLQSGMWGQPGADGRTYDPTIHPNAVDPALFTDAAGRIWMVYGSYSGGIFLLELSPADGVPYPGQGYGRRLIGGHHSRIEAPFILHHPAAGYYYLFLSFGGLSADGGYQVRVGRARTPAGPYHDAAGTDLATVRGPAGSFFDDAAIAPHGVKLIGNYQFLAVAGEPRTTSRGYLSPGHNSAWHDPATGDNFLVFHTRFVGRGEAHEVRVHRFFLNEDDWPVVAPHRFAGEARTPVAPGAIPGTFKFIAHGRTITAEVTTSSLITLAVDGTVSGAATGTWQQVGGSDLRLTLAGTTYRGVLVRQWDDDQRRWVLAFTALSPTGLAVWGSKVAATRSLPALTPPAATSVAYGSTLQLALAGHVSASNGQILTYTLVAGPTGLTLDAATGLLTWQPLLTQAGQSFDVTVRAQDSTLPSLQAEATFRVSAGPAGRVRHLRLEFDTVAAAGLRDGAGQATGFTQRLPGTGAARPEHDPLLALDLAAGQLALTSTPADFNGQTGLAGNTSPGLPLSVLGFTGAQDFAVTAVFQPLPALAGIDQVGVYVGADSAMLTRAGVIVFQSPEAYATHTEAGFDHSGRFSGVAPVPGAGLPVVITRQAGAWRMFVAGTEWSPRAADGTKREPEFLNTADDLTAGIFAITPFSPTAVTVRLDAFALHVATGDAALTPLEAWRDAHFGQTESAGLAADPADPDGDGVSNLFEYSAGRDPHVAEAAPLVALATVTFPDGTHLRLTFTRIADPALTYTVEAAPAPDATSWTTLWTSTGAANLPGPVAVTDPAAAPGTPRRFLRLRVTR